MKTVHMTFILCLLLLVGCSISTPARFDSKKYERLNVLCTVLGKVDVEIIPFRDGPILRAFVPIRLEAPGESREAVKLVLVSTAVKDYNGPKQGTSWHEIGSRQEVEVFRNRTSGEYYLAEGNGSQ